jgi:hypothetical protein
MAEKNRLEQIVGKVVAQVLEKQLPQLRDALVHHVLEELQPHLGKSAGLVAGGAADLLKAVALIHAGTTQKEILRALLESTGHYCGRSALFVMKAGSANGWQGRAFDNNEDIKDFALDVHASAPAQVLQSRTAVAAHISEMDPKFISQFGAPAEDRFCLLPLHLKDKIAALVYADAGPDSGQMDTAALELLVAATSAWLEVASLRKQAAKEEAADSAAPAPASVQTVSSYSDPFAAHVPRHAAAPAAAEQPAMASATAAGSAAAAAPATDAFAQMSPEEADIHRKAQRFARLLIDEVKLYNQAKVAEGRKHKDLYDRLKEDIEKSRATYTKRYGNTAAASADYLNAEVIRSLAEDDVSLLGPNFHR